MKLEYINFLQREIDLKKTSNKKYYIITYIEFNLSNNLSNDLSNNSSDNLSKKFSNSNKKNNNSNGISNIFKYSFKTNFNEHINDYKKINLKRSENIDLNSESSVSSCLYLNSNNEKDIFNITEIDASYIKEFAERKKVIIENLSKCQNEVIELKNEELIKFLKMYYGGSYGN